MYVQVGAQMPFQSLSDFESHAQNVLCNFTHPGRKLEYD